VKKTWPAAARNAEPIGEILKRLLKQPCSVLEIASGTGQHAAYFSQLMPGVDWQASDVDPDSLPSIESWRQESGLPNFLEPLLLDVCGDQWPETSYDFLFCANMIHIAPWRSCLGLLRGGSRVLDDGGALLLYGPFRVADTETAPGNVTFDESLRSRNPEWGVRDLEEVAAAAAECGLQLEERIPMPANNLIVVFRKG
jgi:SAM-dependent methyltransferase